MNRELDFIDILSILSFIIALQNLDLNINEQDMSRQTSDLNEILHKEIEDIHSHLSVQDSKLNVIMNRLEEINGSKRNLSENIRTTDKRCNGA